MVLKKPLKLKAIFRLGCFAYKDVDFIPADNMNLIRMILKNIVDMHSSWLLWSQPHWIWYNNPDLLSKLNYVLILPLNFILYAYMPRFDTDVLLKCLALVEECSYACLLFVRWSYHISNDVGTFSMVYCSWLVECQMRNGI